MTTTRPATLHDLPGVYRVCLETGDSGRDATALYRNPDLLGHVYVGPYVVGQPELAFVAADADGVAGYCLAAEDTRAFEEWEDEHWWPSLRDQYPLTPGSTPDDEIIRMLHTRPSHPDRVVAAYPSHMHIDLLERVRGQGLGRILVQRVLDELAKRGSAGLHLGVGLDNSNARTFYRHLGFIELESNEQELFMGVRLA